MRSCVANLTWEKILKKRSNNNFLSIDFKKFREIDEEIKIPDNGIIAFCGLNGVGKSTILATIRDLIGIELNPQERNIIGETDIIATFNHNHTPISVDTKKNTIKEQLKDISSFSFIDFETINQFQKLFINDENVKDLIEQNEDRKYENSELIEINTLIGKQYQEIKCIEVEYSDNITIPFFEIIEENFSYDSTKMGKGEYYLHYIFWLISKSTNNSTIILDEPENGISISSQKKLMDYLALFIEKKNINLFITTHSPYILERLPIECIKIITRNGVHTSIISPKGFYQVNSFLDLDVTYEGILLVEDKTAKDYLLRLLELYNPNLLSLFLVTIAVGGDTSIKEILTSCNKIENYPLKVFGFFDGDDRNNKQFNTLENVFFLPGQLSFEEEFLEFIKDSKNRKKIVNELKINDDDFILSMQKHNGKDYHDVFMCLFNDMHLSGKDFVNAYCNVVPKGTKNVFKKFISDFSKKIQQN